jgi:hypothetical protein
MAYDIPWRALARSARRTDWTARPVAPPTRDPGPAERWTGLRDANLHHAEDDAGNPCRGIVIGCVLSLPIWLALVSLVLVLIG